MKKTSVYLTEEERRRLKYLACVEGRSQAAVIREAIARYEPTPLPDRDFKSFNAGVGPGDSIADMDDDELLEGFGDDSFGSWRS